MPSEEGVIVGKANIPIVSISRNTPYIVDLTVDEADIPLQFDEPGFLQSVHIEGSLSAMQQDFLYQGTLTALFERTCDRCLALTSMETSIEVGWLFELGTPLDAMEEFAKSEESEEEEEFEDSDESEQIHYYDGVNIDFSEAIAEEISMATPTKIYCAETCKGLCPQCGVNLNTTTCDCTPEPEIEETNSGFAGLKELFPDLPNKPSEE
jgi:uncharacterized protein